MSESKGAEQNKVAKPSDIRDIIKSDAGKEQFKLALPKHLTADRFVRIALTAINKTPNLIKCTRESVLVCLMDCSQMGLEPDGRKVHLIPFLNRKTNQYQCSLIVDYKGLVELARRSGVVSDIHADIVCENDQFEYSFGSDGKLVHKPAIKDRGEVVAAYSFVRLRDGSVSYEVMNVEEIESIHRRSKAKEDGPWKTDFNEMAKKTVFRRHSKWLPFSPEVLEFIEKDYDTPADITRNIKPFVEMPKALGEIEEKPAEMPEGTAENNQEPSSEPESNPEPEEQPKQVNRISPAQLEAIRKLAENNGYDVGQLNTWLVKKYGIIGGASMIPAEGSIYDKICSDIVGAKLPGRKAKK